MNLAGFGAVLMAVWLLLWGSLSVANVLSGIAVVGIVLAVLPDSRFTTRRPPIRPVAIARLTVRILTDMVRANMVVTREILTRDSSINEGVVEVPVPGCSDALLTFVADVLALSPGVMPIEVSRDPGTIWVHVLHLEDPERTRRDVGSLAELAVRAFGTAEVIEWFGAGGRSSTGTTTTEVDQ